MSEHCYHCGDEVIGKGVHYDNKVFCCNGCKGVYQLLSDNALGDFYNMENKPGTKPLNSDVHRYAFLNVEEIRSKFIDFEDDKITIVTLFLPKIHCSSCIYLLENITKIEPAIQSCQVDFSKRTANIIFDHNKLSLENLALLLDRIGYAPNFSSQKEIKKKRDLSYLYKLGVAGFAFGSIMLWTFPEYLGVSEDNPEFRNFSAWLSFAVSLPVLFYSANEYLISAFKTLRYGSINLDVPISLGILALYFKSAYNIFSGLGPGYMDSFAGFVFFLLIGKWFQSKTYDSLSFERDYTSYFPVAVSRINTDGEEIVEIDKLQIGDTIRLRNEEVIPCDSELVSKSTQIDFSFVTGESEPVQKKAGEFIYAGGRVKGDAIDLRVVKESSRSHLTQLWNDAGEKHGKTENTDKVSIYFLVAVLVIAAITAIYYSITGSESVTEIVVAVLIVACPCALALSKPFTYGNIMRVMGRYGLYLKNTGVIPTLNEIKHIVFDKTGTLTKNDPEAINFEGTPLNETEKGLILITANSSTHPLSRAIVRHLLQEKPDTSSFEISAYTENSGQGVKAMIGDTEIRLGSASFVEAPKEEHIDETATYISINGRYRGKYIFKSSIRDGVPELLSQLEERYKIHVLSGDKEKDRNMIAEMLQDDSNLQFSCTPKEKSEYIQYLQNTGEKVLMIGDGLNDSGALERADVGIAVSEDMFRFTPSSDAIIKSDSLNKLDRLLKLSNYAKKVLRVCYGFSLIYNVLGLSFAVSGQLTPLVAAILMPISSITIVVIATFSTVFKRI